MNSTDNPKQDPPADVPEKDAGQFPSEWTAEFQENYTEEQRQNLYQKILNMSSAQKVQLAIMGNREARNLLIHDPSKMISLAVLRNPKINENEIIKIAQQKNISEDVILAIAKHQKWIRQYEVKLAVVGHPKTPLSVAISFLSHLHEKDLKSLTRDRNISPMLRRMAQQAELKRKG
jgi:hypothetical protein